MQYLTFFWPIITALPGLASLVFLILDRWIKGKPEAFYHAVPNMDGSGILEPVLCVKNTSASTIIIRWPNGFAHNTFRASVDASIEAYYTLVAEDFTRCAILPGDQVNLVLFKPVDYEAIDADGFLEFSFAWWNINPVLYKVPRKLRRRIQKSDIEFVTGVSWRNQ